MKKSLIFLLAMTMTLSVLTSCGKAGSQNAQSDTPESQPNASIPNPMKSVTPEEMLEAVGFSLKAPADASDVTYHIIESGSGDKLAQVSFSRNNKSFTYRAQASAQTQAYDMSGLYYTWTEEKDVQVSYCPAKLTLCAEAAALYWLDIVPGVNYTLGCSAQSDEAEMLEVAGLVFVALQGES